MRNTHQPLYYSLFLHTLVLIMLTVGLHFSERMPVTENSNANKNIIQARVMTLPAAQPIPKPPTPVQPAPTPQPKPQPEKSQQPVAVKKDSIALKPAPKKPVVVKPNAEQVKKQREKIAKELLADLQKQTEKKKKTNPATLKAHFAKSLQRQLFDEEVRLQAEKTQQSQGEVNKYKALILQTIGQNWLVPGRADKKLTCELLIRVAPGGMVLDVQVIKSSGDTALDRSARMAVLKSSPLPVPTDAAAFDAFRQFVLKVKPENITANESIV